MVDTLQLARLTNTRIYFHPVTLAVYGLCLATLTKLSGVLRTNDWGRMVLFTASLTAGFLIAGEWLTRGRFEAKATDSLRSDSLVDIQKFFGKDKFLVATLGETDVIGVVGLQTEGRTGTLRHWHVKTKYRERGLGSDMLEMLIENNKGSKKHPLQRIQCETYNLQKRAEKSLKDHGFQRNPEEVKEPGLLGFFGVRKRTWVKEL
jgi:N-acetylglutamate synthase-like GNAT family acetyltransferase